MIFHENAERFSKPALVPSVVCIGILLTATVWTNVAYGKDRLSSDETNASARTVEVSANPEIPGAIKVRLGSNAPFNSLGLAEYKSKMLIDVGASRSRVFKIDNWITRTSISNSELAEPVVVSPHEFVLLGKKPGDATLAIWDNTGKVAVFDLKITKDDDTKIHPAAAKIPAVNAGTVNVEEYSISKSLDLDVSNAKMFKTKKHIVRTAISNPAIAELVEIAKDGVCLTGKHAGTATLFLWDDLGNVSGFELRVTTGGNSTLPSNPNQSSLPESTTLSAATTDVEKWSAAHKDIQHASSK
jgi:Flp pilus assembly secretin CpaC